MQFVGKLQKADVLNAEWVVNVYFLGATSLTNPPPATFTIHYSTHP